MTTLDVHAAVEGVVRFYETLTPASLDQLGQLYAPDAHFQDPFNAVQGLPDIARVFSHMFESLDAPRFVVTDRLVDGQRAVLSWQFLFRMRRWQPQREQCIQGVTWLTFDDTGRVSHHRDYWDAAQELYEKLPVLGRLMQWLRRTASATADQTTRMS